MALFLSLCKKLRENAPFLPGGLQVEAVCALLCLES